MGSGVIYHHVLDDLYGNDRRILGMKFDWNIKQGEVDDIVQALLENRGITEDSDVTAFLNPNWDEHTYDPFIFKQMKEAVDKLLIALEQGKS